MRCWVWSSPGFVYTSFACLHVTYSSSFLRVDGALSSSTAGGPSEPSVATDLPLNGAAVLSLLLWVGRSRFEIAFLYSSLNSGSCGSPRIPESSRPGSPGRACALSTFSVVPGSVRALKRTKGFSSVGSFSSNMPWVSLPKTDLSTGSNEEISPTLVVMLAFRVGEPRFR